MADPGTTAAGFDLDERARARPAIAIVVLAGGAAVSTQRSRTSRKVGRCARR
jgi:hypothetical protein